MTTTKTYKIKPPGKYKFEAWRDFRSYNFLGLAASVKFQNISSLLVKNVRFKLVDEYRR